MRVAVAKPNEALFVCGNSTSDSDVFSNWHVSLVMGSPAELSGESDPVSVEESMFVSV